ncbi:hypothetical protein NIES4101_85860 [Calothrix sp. NIES-4101]|nr:hypothetical protein NIES4101_85860 [Calothrix sp. NIES-4101]
MNSLIASMEFEPLPLESLSIEPEDINRAIALSQDIPDESRQWQMYVNSLGLFTLQKWLEERDDNLMLNWQESTIAQPALANVIPAITNLHVGEFKVCLITLDSVFDEQVILPRLVVDLPEFIPHFYVLVEVMEEQESGLVQGVLTYQQLIEKLESSPTINPQPNWTYEIPLDWFEKDPNLLLLYLRNLEANAISLPTPSDRQQQLVAIKNDLVNLLPQLQSPETELWQVLNWEQGSLILTSTDLLDWIYQLQTNNLQVENTTLLQTYLLDLIKIVTQPALNLGRWLWGELDELGESLAWELFPRLSSVRELRSPAEEFAAIESQLKTQGIEIPTVGQCGHYNFLLAGNSLRIYAFAWNSSTEIEPNTWSLFLILGAPTPNRLPNNLKFRVSDRTGILTEQQANSQQVNSYLFTTVAGNWDEKFLVTVSITERVELTLPPFAFDIQQM